MKSSPVVKLAIGVLMLSAGALTFFSGHVAMWWGTLASPSHFAEGSLPFRVLTWRASLDEADVHFAIWLIAGLVLLTPRVGRHGAMLICLGLVVIGVGVELMQPALSTRNGEWGDAVGALFGTCVAALMRVTLSFWRSRNLTTAVDALSFAETRPSPRLLKGPRRNIGSALGRRHRLRHP